MADKLMCIPNDDTKNYSFCRLKYQLKRQNTQLNETTNKNKNKTLFDDMALKTLPILKLKSIIARRKKNILKLI